MNPILSAIQAVKREREEAAALRRHLQSDLDLAVEHVRNLCKSAGLQVNAEACTCEGTHRRSVATGDNAAGRHEIGVLVCLPGRLPASAGAHAVCLFKLRWSPATMGRETGCEDDREDPMPAGWCVTDCTSDRRQTAVAAIDGALLRPETMRRVAEALINLGA